MARIATTAVANNEDGIRQASIPNGATIIAVELRRNIELGGTDSTAGVTRVRPTNVTATAGLSETSPNQIILLHNGPAGGFRQDYKPGTGDSGNTTIYFNAVVGAVITNQ